MSKRIIIPREDLPNISSATGSYSVRYRIISQDRNRLSYWSPIFETIPETTYDFNENNINVSRIGSRFTITWEPVIVKAPSGTVGSLQEYDLWVQWSKGESNAKWLYRERVLGNPVTLFSPSQYSLIDPVTKIETVIEEEPDQLSVEIYIPADPPIRSGAIYEESGP
jgi:hypothetical protein